MSSPKVRHFLNNLLFNIGEARYLEVGIWKVIGNHQMEKIPLSY